MDFTALQDVLRNIIADRIDAGQLTGAALAQKIGFRQAHVSNFLNRRRGLSIEAMDRILCVLGLTVLDLVDPAEINRRATAAPPPDGAYTEVLLVDPAIAVSQPLIARSAVQEILKFRRNFLRHLRPEMLGSRQEWIRFVLVKADAANAAAMHPCISAGALLLIDRHYNSLRPYRRGHSNIYAVAKDDRLLIGYLEVQQSHLLLRPHSPRHPLVAVGSGKSGAGCIVGRVCLMVFEC